MAYIDSFFFFFFGCLCWFILHFEKAIMSFIIKLDHSYQNQSAICYS